MDMIVDELADGVTNVAVRGRLDRLGAETTVSRFDAIADSKRAVVVDLSGVDFLASLGIRVLLTSAKTLQSKGGKLAIVAQGNVLTVLQVAGLDALIPVFERRNEAIAAVGS
jgi:anti-anti-sigma factor